MVVDVGDGILNDASGDRFRGFAVTADEEFGQHVDDVVVEKCFF